MSWPKMALTNMIFKTKNWFHLEGRPTRREREGRGKERRRRKGREKEEKERSSSKQKGMELLTLSMELGFLVWILGFVWLKVCPKPRV